MNEGPCCYSKTDKTRTGLKEKFNKNTEELVDVSEIGSGVYEPEAASCQVSPSLDDRKHMDMNLFTLEADPERRGSSQQLIKGFPRRFGACFSPQNEVLRVFLSSQLMSVMRCCHPTPMQRNPLLNFHLQPAAFLLSRPDGTYLHLTAF